MKGLSGILCLCVGVLFTISAQAQQTTQVTAPVRDTQALNILSQALASAGGTSALTSLQDFTATGAITYFWADEETIGSVMVRGLGTTQFRLDATVPNGTRSWAVTAGQGTVKDITGATSPIAKADALTLGGYTFPFLEILNILSDTSTALKYSGVVDVNGHSVHKIQVQRTFPLQLDPDGSLRIATRQTFYFDITTLQLLELDSFAHQEGRITDEYLRTLQFSDYRVVSGISVPFQISEAISGQHTFSIQFSAVAFNSSLTDSDFQL